MILMISYRASEIPDLITAAVGAATLTLSVVKWAERRREKRFCLDVKLSYGNPAYWSGGIGPSVILVEAMNPGNRPVTLTSSGLLLPNGSTLISRGNLWAAGLPRELTAGKNCLTWMEATPVARAICRAGFDGTVKLIGFYCDALGKRHKSESLEFDLTKWQGIATTERSA